MFMLPLSPRRAASQQRLVLAVIGVAALGVLLPAASQAQWSPAGVQLFELPARPGGVVAMSDGQGGLYVSSKDTRDGYGAGSDVYLQHLDAGGRRYPNWPASGLPVCVMINSQGANSLAPDDTGGILLVWGDDRDATTGLRDVYVQRVNSDGSLPPGWQPNGVAACRDPNIQTPNVHYYPVIASDGAGGAYVAWDDERDDTTGMARINCYVQRLLADGSIAPGWPPDGRAACQAPLERGSGPVIPDGQGGMVVVFGDTRRGIPEPFDVDIYGQRIQADGTNAPGWPAEGKLLVSRFAGIRGVLPDAAGGFYVIRSRLTEESHPYDAELWVHRFTFDGERAAGWPEEGVLVCGGSGSRYDIQVERDAQGGVVFAWWEFRPGQAGEIYVSRIRPDGTLPPGWPVNGLRVSNPASSPYNDFDPAVTYDGTGGLYVTWCRDYNTVSPSYIQHIMADGTVAPGWPEYGHVVATTAEQSVPKIVSDGSGGAIVVWQANYNEFYAARFAADGPVAVSVSLAHSEAAPDRVSLEWRTSEPASFTATLERSEREGEWRALATLTPDGEGRLRHDDRDVEPGRRYGYRLAWSEGGAPRTGAAVWLETPLALPLVLHGFTPNPSPAAATVAFTLPAAGEARLEVLDVAGRRLAAHEVGARGAGRHTLRLDERGPLAPGLYLLRLVTPGRVLTARGVVVK